MQLIKITVSAFQCIEHADVELGPGLNVLYGPNDLGKSSLASAIRAVLLLQHGSSAHEKLVSWHTGDPPKVTLVFKSDDQRFWRVRKTFGSGSAGSSTLEFSKDGSSFSGDCIGREVDGKLRELLRWGIDKPGGRGGPKGFPDSFLTNVLLAEQADVPNILARGLTGDPDESGRALLNEALQALAQDPLFKRVLDDAQAQVERAFTSKGARSSRKDSPFRQIGEEIRKLREDRDELQQKLNDTLSAEGNLQKLHGDLDVLAVGLVELKEKLSQVEEAHRKKQLRVSVGEELQVALKALEEINAELEDVRKAASTVETLQGELEVAEKALLDATTAEKDASNANDQAKERLREVNSEQEAQQRELRRQQLENDRHKAKDRASATQAKIAAAQEAQRLSDAALGAKRELDEVADQLAKAEATATSLAEQHKSAKEDLDRSRAIETYGRLEEARKRLALAESAAAMAKADRDKAASLRSEAAQLDAEAGELRVPDGEIVKALRTLAQSLEVAEARLGGGLSVVISPRKNIRLQVAVDGAEPREHRGRDTISLEGQRSVVLGIEALVDVTITAGEADARQQVEDLRKRWIAEGAPVLERAGVADVALLEAARANADDLSRRSAQLRTESQTLDQRADQHEEQAGALEALQQRVRDLEQSLTDDEREVLSPLFAGLGDSWERELERHRASAEGRANKAAAKLDKARSRVTELKTRHTERESSYQKTREVADRASEAFPDGVESVLEPANRELDQLNGVIADLTQQIDGLAGAAESKASEAQQAFQDAARSLEAAIEARKTAETARSEKREALGNAKGNLEALRKQTGKLDVDAAQRKVSEIEARLAEIPDSPVTAEDVLAATNEVKAAEHAVADKQGEIHKAQGGLEQVGGAVVREQKEELDRALNLALEREHQIELDCDAWKLLADTLREVENTDGAHLGKALSGPVTELFKELTAGRYGALAIGPDLNAEGLEAGGEIRPFDAFSVGTQDQLATLFRLCIAEHLCSAIVLDDHLSQSDPEKIRWFGDLLRRTGQAIQIVLLTCRAGDYLLPEEIPDTGKITRDLAGGALRAVDLGLAIRRYPLVGPKQKQTSVGVAAQ